MRRPGATRSTCLGWSGSRTPRARFDEYPHEFSGGMRQRAMIAMALTNDPKLLIADEPTTALDVTIQAQILRLLARLQSELGMAMILITHDLGVVVEVASEIIVLYGGGWSSAGPLMRSSMTRSTRIRGASWALSRGWTAAVRSPHPDRRQPPSLLSPPEGCHFRPRCPHEFSKCSMVPPLDARAEGTHRPLLARRGKEARDPNAGERRDRPA